MFGNGKKTVEGITKSLVQIKADLKTLEKEKQEELKQYAIEKEQLDKRISEAEAEKTKGFTIFKNISNLLGEPVKEEEKTG